MFAVKLRQKSVIVELDDHWLVDHGIDLPQVFVRFANQNTFAVRMRWFFIGRPFSGEYEKELSYEKYGKISS